MRYPSRESSRRLRTSFAPVAARSDVVPALIFYVFLLRAGPGPAMVSVLVWSYGAVIRRLVGGHRIPSILMLAVLGLTVRTIVGFTSGTFMYFLQPVVGTLVLAAVFLGSVFVGRPIIGRLALRLLSALTRDCEPALRYCGCSAD